VEAPATRAARHVQARRSADVPVVAAYAGTLPAKANAYIAAYEAVAKYENTWRREMKEGKGAVAELLKAIRSWLPFLVRDVGGFDPSTFGDQPGVPDDVIEDGERLAAEFDEAVGADGEALPYKDAAIAALGPAILAANKEWSEAEAADSTYQKLLKESRAAGAVFDIELQAFRRSFGAAVGRNDKDFQKLRVERAAQKDEDDDAGAPPPPTPVEPAPAESKPPVAPPAAGAKPPTNK
jgi:hypothetical protein